MVLQSFNIQRHIAPLCGVIFSKELRQLEFGSVDFFGSFIAPWFTPSLRHRMKRTYKQLSLVVVYMEDLVKVLWDNKGYLNWGKNRSTKMVSFKRLKGLWICQLSKLKVWKTSILLPFSYIHTPNFVGLPIFFPTLNFDAWYFFHPFKLHRSILLNHLS